MNMLVSDYDDTFYINDTGIKNNVELTKSFMKNNIFAIATGRSLFGFKKKQDLYNIKFNYLIINHGATIIKDNEIIYNKVIDNQIKNKLLNDLQINKIISRFACSGLESRLEFKNNDLTKIHARYQSKETALEVCNLINKKYFNHISAFLVCNLEAVEIVSNEANKSNAIKHVASLEKIEAQNIYTIGDSYSDIQMIKDFKGYAMSNALDELKKYAVKEVTSVSELINMVLDDENEQL